MSINFISPVVKLCGQNLIKFDFGWGSAPEPAGGAYDAPPDPLVGWQRGILPPHTPPLDAFGISISTHVVSRN